MKLEEVKSELPLKLYEVLSSKYKELTSAQIKAIKAGLFEGKNLLVCSPTGSGKTLVAEIAALKAILERGGKTIYTVPLKALASEKFNDFKERYEKLGVRIALSIGDLDSADNYLQSYDLIVCSNEKLDSLIRHSAQWLEDVSVIVVDEIHLLNDLKRGPTLEVLITMLRSLLNVQIIALSATIGNPHELADWLNAKLVQDNWRPVKLYEGIAYKGVVDFFKEKVSLKIPQIQREETMDLAIQTLSENKQALIFVNSKRSAEALAENISKVIDRMKSKGKTYTEITSRTSNDEVEKELTEFSQKILRALSHSTKQCEKLAYCVEKGIAFHHAGLAPNQRSIVEKAFKEGKIKIICCTPTLSLGLEFPTDRAIVRDLRRFSGYSQEWIPTLEIKQFVGRAGRPTYHTEGEAICIAKTEAEKDEIYERYICGEPEEITSKLAVEPVLRMYLLSLIAIGFTRTTSQIRTFFEKTFWAFQYGDIDKIELKLEKILSLLEKYRFIKREGEKLKATPLGLRVAQLYIDPVSAYHIMKSIAAAEQKGINEVSIMQCISATAEMRPLLSVRNSEVEDIEAELLKYEDLLYADVDEYSEFYENFLASFKTALMLRDWLNEYTEEMLLEKYKIRPGELLVKIHNTDWLLYAFEQLAILLGKQSLLTDIAKLRVRLKYGIKAELLALIRFKNIGRVRSRLLYNAGVHNRRDVNAASLEKLSAILRSKEIAKQLKEQVEVREG